MDPKDEELIDVGDGLEKEVEIELEEDNASIQANDDNPNVSDQLQGASGENDNPEQDNRTPQERYEAFLEADPEAGEYSKKVKKRIDKLTYKYHEEERQKDAALQYAEGLKKENEQLRQYSQQGQQGYILAQQKHLTSELEQAKSLYKEAHAANDPELMAEASQNIAAYSSQLTQVNQAVERIKRGQPLPGGPNVRPQQFPNEQPGQQDDQQHDQQRAAPQRRVKPDPKAEEWAERNEWFGEDKEMTQGAFQIHQQLVAQEGYVPSSEAYYTELDARIRKNYPGRFKEEQRQGNSNPAPEMGGGQQTLTPGDGGAGNGRGRKTRVKLSPSQVAIAKKLGVPLEEYAKYV